MKIVCPHCQAAYQVNIPGLKTKDVDVKCARCKSKFIVKKHGAEEEKISPEQTVDALAGEAASEALADEKDTVYEAGSVETSVAAEETPAEQSNDLDFEDDNKLDDYLDKILEKELGSPDPEAIKAQSSIDIDSTVEEVDKDLDSLLNNLIDEGLKTDLDDSPDNNVDEPPVTEGNENYPEDLLGEIMSEEQQEESAPPPATENQETEVSTPEAPPEKEAIPQAETAEPTQVGEKEDPVAVEEDSVSEKETSVEEKVEEKTEAKEEEGAEVATAEEEAPETTEKSDEELWAEAFADQEATEQSAEKEGTEVATQAEEKTAENDASTEPVAKAEGSEAAEKSEEDLWAEAFAEQENLSESLGTKEEPAETPVETKAEEKEDIKEEEKSDEDLWAEAFADQEATEQSAEKAEDENETPQAEEDEASSDEEQPEATTVAETTAVAEESEADEGAFDNLDDDQDDDDLMAEGLNDEEEEEALPEEAYNDDYNEEEFEFKSKRKLFSIPKTRTGKIIMAGSALAVLLTAGGIYFTLQTFAPTELAGLEKAETVVPEGLTPNESGETPPDPGQNPQPKADPIVTEDTSSGASGIEQELAQSEKLKVSEATIKDVSNLNNLEALEAALSPRSNTVTIQTIMPVAYNINDIRVLTFNMEVVMDNDKTADVLRDALPVFERLTLEGVEELLHKKFYNDVLYVKEKLQKKIRNDINAKLEGGGHVKKVKFKEFSIQ